MMLFRNLFLLAAFHLGPSFSRSSSSGAGKERSSILPPSIYQSESRSPPASPQGENDAGSLERRVAAFGGCSAMEQAYLEQQLNGDIHDILQAGIATSLSVGQWSRRKFREFFGTSNAHSRAKVSEWLTEVTIERLRTPHGRWALYCRLDQSRCDWQMYGYVQHLRDQIVLVSRLWLPRPYFDMHNAHSTDAYCSSQCPRFWNGLIPTDGRLVDNEARGPMDKLRTFLLIMMGIGAPPDRIGNPANSVVFTTVLDVASHDLVPSGLHTFVQGVHTSERQVRNVWVIMEFAFCKPSLFFKHTSGIFYFISSLLAHSSGR